MFFEKQLVKIGIKCNKMVSFTLVSFSNMNTDRLLVIITIKTIKVYFFLMTNSNTLRIFKYTIIKCYENLINYN